MDEDVVTAVPDAGPISSEAEAIPAVIPGMDVPALCESDDVVARTQPDVGAGPRPAQRRSVVRSLAYVREPCSRTPSPVARRQRRRVAPGMASHPPLTAYEGEASEQHRSHRGSALNVLIDASAAVTPDDLCLFLRKARRKLRDGIFVAELRLSRSTNLTGMLKKKDPEIRCTKHMRQLYIGFQPEYLEITTQYSIETTLHLSAIDRVSCTSKAEPFRRYKMSNVVNDKCCLLITSSSKDQICLLFTNEEDRRLAEFNLRVERQAILLRYKSIETDYVRLLKENKITDVGLARSVLAPPAQPPPNAKAKPKASASKARPKASASKAK